MTHLREEEMIDVLMGETHRAEWDAHLADCEICRRQLRTLRLGLSAAREVEPKVPLMALPKISYREFKQRGMKSRFLWVAAAAMFLLSFLGFRLEVGEQGVAFQFSLLGKGDTATDARIRGLEESLIKAIELNAALTQSQLDARFNAFYQERTEDLGAFSRIVSDKMEDLEMKNALYLATVKDDLKNDLRETQLKGKLQ